MAALAFTRWHGWTTLNLTGHLHCHERCIFGWLLRVLQRSGLTREQFRRPGIVD